MRLKHVCARGYAARASGADVIVNLRSRPSRPNNLCGNQPVSGDPIIFANRRRVDGVEIDAAIQDERAVSLISTQAATSLIDLRIFFA